MEIFNFLPKYESLHSSIPIIFLLKNGTLRDKDIRSPHFTRWRVSPCPSHATKNYEQFYSIKEAIGKDICPDGVYHLWETQHMSFCHLPVGIENFDDFSLIFACIISNTCFDLDPGDAHISSIRW